MQGVQACTYREFRFRIVCLLAVFAVAMACMAQEGKPAADAAIAAATTQAADAKDNNPQKDSGGENARKKQIADESAELLTMALALKAEVDKTSKDTLSLNVIKKADQIEKLAKQVKEKIKNSGS